MKKNRVPMQYARMLMLMISVALFPAVRSSAQISVGAAGSIPETFNSQPSTASWTTAESGADHAYADEPSLDAAIQAIPASSITSAVAANSGNPPGTAHLAVWSSSGLYVQTRPTGNGLAALMATLHNDSGNSIPNLSISYTLTIRAASTTELIPGHRVYYSLTGNANEWVPLGDFATPGGVSIPVDLSATPWAAGSTLYVLLVDHNTATNPDGAYDIDDFAITLPGIPPSIVTQPVSLTNAEYSVNSLTVVASGSAPISYQWKKNGVDIAGATTSTLVLTNTTGTGYTWGRPEDSGDYSVTVTGSANPPATSSTAHVVIMPDTNAPTMLYALALPNGAGTTVKVIFSEQFADMFPLTNEVFEWTAPTTSPAGEGLSSPSLITQISATEIDLEFGDPIDPAATYRLDFAASITPHDRAQTPNAMTVTSIPLHTHEQEILPINSVWKYDDAVTQSSPADNWRDVGYDDSDVIWKQGTAPFDAKKAQNGAQGTDCRDTTTFYGLTGIPLTCIAITNSATGVENPTVFFRTHFTIDAAIPTNIIMRLNGKFDDSGIIYLNGAELARVGFPAGTSVASLSRTNYGTSVGGRSVGDGDAQDTAVLFPGSLLRTGDNLVAVEIQQVINTSSDMTMALRAVIDTVAPLGAAAPRMSVVRDAGTGQITISWTGGGTLQQSTDVGTTAAWTDVSALSPYQFTPAAGVGQKFFRIR